MELGTLTTDITNKLFYKFEKLTIKIAQVIQEYLSVAFLYVLSIEKSSRHMFNFSQNFGWLNGCLVSV